VILKFLAPYLLPAGGAVLVFALLFGGAQTWKLKRAEAKLVAQEQYHVNTINAMVAKHAEAVAGENAKVAAIEATLNRLKEEAQNAINAAYKANANIRAAFAAVRVERDGLRSELATAIATGGVEASADTIQACRERAETAGVLLGKALRTSEECAGDAEDLAAGVRGLSASWPSTH
jgi:hypothetical protein